MILILDNYDSFTFNLADYFSQLNIKCEIYRNDVPVKEIFEKNYSAIVLSPGPGIPSSSGNMMEIIDLYHNKLPILGICLGHQALGQYFGAKLKKALRPMHGKISEMICKSDEIFNNIPSKFNVVGYHSLTLTELPFSLKILGESSNGETLAIKHSLLPIYGLQYHPEAVLTEYGKEILKNWIVLNKITD